MTNKELYQKLEGLLGGEEAARRFRIWVSGVIKKALERQSNLTNTELFLEQATSILSDLNQRTGRRYTLTSECTSLIRALFAQGYLPEDFKRVHEVMCAKWLSNPDMRDYLRPSTLWQAKKFDERLALWDEYDAKRPGRRCKDLKAERQDVAPTGGSEQKAERQDVAPTMSREQRAEQIAKLMSRTWDSFASWAEFMRWTMQLPDAEAIEEYPMPKRIRQMRTAPYMGVHCVMGKSPEWAEAEYQLIKQGVKE